MVKYNLLINVLERQEKTMRTQEKTMRTQEKTMSAVLEVLVEIGDKDCYDRCSESSKPRELTNAAYERTYSVPVPDLRCMITGISQRDTGDHAP